MVKVVYGFCVSFLKLVIMQKDNRTRNKQKYMRFTATVKKDDEIGLYVAWCPELDIASQGESVEDALKNLKEALELYFEDGDAMFSDENVLISVIDVPVKRAKIKN